MIHNAYEFPLGIMAGPVGFCFKPLTHSKPIEKPLCIYGSSATDIPQSYCLLLLGLVHLEALESLTIWIIVKHFSHLAIIFLIMVFMHFQGV